MSSWGNQGDPPDDHVPTAVSRDQRVGPMGTNLQSLVEVKIFIQIYIIILLYLNVLYILWRVVYLHDLHIDLCFEYVCCCILHDRYE